MQLPSRFLRSVQVMLLAVAFLMLGGPGVAAAQTVEGPTPNEIGYLNATKPYRDRLGAYQEMLSGYQQQAAAGHLDEIALADLANLSREMFTAHTAFNEAGPSARLDLYHRTMVLGLSRSYDATVMLLEAQVTRSEAEHQALIRQAGEYGSSALRLLREAAAELQTVLPSATEQSPATT